MLTIGSKVKCVPVMPGMEDLAYKTGIVKNIGEFTCVVKFEGYAPMSISIKELSEVTE